MKTIKEMLDELENALRDGSLTPTKEIDSGTFICTVEEAPNGKIYHQNHFEKLPLVWQNVLKNKNKGTIIPVSNGNKMRVVAIFDAWA
jgi:hypothetical protein